MSTAIVVLIKPFILMGLLLIVRPVTRAIHIRMKPGPLRRFLFVSWK